MAKKKNGRRGPAEEQVELLRGIWNEMKGLNSRVDKTNERLEAVRIELKAELETVRIDLKGEVDAPRRRVVESEVRLATSTTQLSSDVQVLSGLIREWREEHRADRADIKARVLRLEQHAGFRTGE
jgi:outer membrane murein-binding lipoprotein Lpp